MRIISGKYKGRNFIAKLPTGIRPTQEAVRETIFNILSNRMQFEGKTVADICAGAGMLGIEALSRGAKKVHFIDKNQKSLDYIKNNLSTINVDNASFDLHRLDATQFVNHYAKTISPSKQLEIIFVDPPYNTGIVNDIICRISEKNILADGGIIVAESAIFTQILLPNNFILFTERQFGAAKVTLLIKEKNYE